MTEATESNNTVDSQRYVTIRPNVLGCPPIPEDGKDFADAVVLESDGHAGADVTIWTSLKAAHVIFRLTSIESDTPTRSLNYYCTAVADPLKTLIPALQIRIASAWLLEPELLPVREDDMRHAIEWCVHHAKVEVEREAHDRAKDGDRG